MPITTTPGVYYSENVEYELEGEGSKIPIFIGRTGNKSSESEDRKCDGSEVLKFKRWSEINRPVNEGGLGVYETEVEKGEEEEGFKSVQEANLMLHVLKEFFEEAKMNTSADIGVPYIYVIDLGEANSKDAWLKAMEVAKTKAESTLEVYVGLEWATEGYDIPDLLQAAYKSIEEGAHYLKLRSGITTKFDVKENFEEYTNHEDIDKELVKLTSETGGVQKQRIAIAEPYLFGKTVARICVTPTNMEPGYFVYRSVEPETFLPRTLEQQLKMQSAGIIINRDEVINDNTYPKILLSVYTCFAANVRPADSLLHARYNADNLLRQVFETVYPQIKNNETATNIAIMQTALDGLVDAEVLAGNMIQFNEDTGDGTKLTLVESDSNPYDMLVVGTIQPVNCTIAINVEAVIQNPVIQAVPQTQV